MADFSANTENIYSVAQDAASKSKEYNQSLVDFYAKVDALASYWQGVDYDVFKEKAYSHKSKLEVAGETLKKYSDLLNNAAASIDQTSASIQKYMNDNF